MKHDVFFLLNSDCPHWNRQSENLSRSRRMPSTRISVRGWDFLGSINSLGGPELLVGRDAWIAKENGEKEEGMVTAGRASRRVRAKLGQGKLLVDSHVLFYRLPNDSTELRQNSADGTSSERNPGTCRFSGIEMRSRQNLSPTPPTSCGCNVSMTTYLFVYFGCSIFYLFCSGTSAFQIQKLKYQSNCIVCR